ncbi:hypothetical protein [Spirulina subsalsa]|uniref:hypothetical protein n=1 Tax=Spirulina subsalsa TaxID=54311 RepID=UPI0002EC4C7B|nr:hypothetical protein [Spirulina subsalsa]
MKSEQLQQAPVANSFNPYNTNSTSFDFELWAQAVRSQMLNVVQKKNESQKKEA